MEFIDEIATQLTELQFGDETYGELPSGTIIFGDEAQDFYNERYDEVESLYIKLILQIPKQL